MQIPQGKSIFTNRQPIFTTLSVILIGFIIFGVVILDNIFKGNIQPIGMPDPTATRLPESYNLEGQAFFASGDLNGAINSYEKALGVFPDNVLVLTELSRLLIYQSAMETDSNKLPLMEKALNYINHAVEVDPSNSNAYAVRGLVYDWYADLADTLDERDARLIEANLAINNAITLESNNALAVAYRAEILADQLQFTQAVQLAQKAVELNPNIMDTHRVYGYVLESTGNYSQAIEEYKKAVAITPNLTFLYISIGLNYRQLRLYDQALDYFDRAASINETLKIKDPLPYIAIAKTYARQGEFFIAARNAEKALNFDPTNPDVYGQLGIIRFRARNYEGSIPVLRCAVEGCTAYYDDVYGVYVPEDPNDIDQEDIAGMEPQAVFRLPLSNVSVVYYYTYGSVLAALDRCAEALPILDQVETVFSNDELIMGILQESYFICSID